MRDATSALENPNLGKNSRIPDREKAMLPHCALWSLHFLCLGSSQLVSHTRVESHKVDEEVESATTPFRLIKIL